MLLDKLVNRRIRGCPQGGGGGCGLWRGGNRRVARRRGAGGNRHRGRQALRQAGAAKAKQECENPVIHALYSQGFFMAMAFQPSIYPNTNMTQKGKVRMEAICSVVVMAAISLASPPMARAMT